MLQYEWIHHNYDFCRLSQLKQSGEEDWKKRVSKPSELQAGEVEVKLREKKGLELSRPSSIADRLNLLETSKIGWKGRVEEKDAVRFTVAHKLAGKCWNVNFPFTVLCSVPENLCTILWKKRCTSLFTQGKSNALPLEMALMIFC